MEILELKNVITEVLLKTQWICLITDWKEEKKESLKWNIEQ